MRGIDSNPNFKAEHEEHLANMSSSKLFLYDHPVSSYAQKVRMALRFKNVEFDKETPQNLGSGDANKGFFDANPRMEVPALVDGDFKVFDSTAILMYLEDKFPEPALLPKDPKDRAEARMIEEVCDTQYEGLNWAVGEVRWFERATGDEAKRLLASAEEQTYQIQEWLAGKLGTKDYFNGRSPGYADFSVAPIVNRSVHYGYGPKEGTTLQKWLARISEVPLVKSTFEEMQEGAKMMVSLGPGLWKPHGGRRREYRDHRLEWMIKNGGIDIVQQGLKDDNIRFSWPHPK